MSFLAGMIPIGKSLAMGMGSFLGKQALHHGGEFIRGAIPGLKKIGWDTLKTVGHDLFGRAMTKVGQMLPANIAKFPLSFVGEG